MIGAIENAIVEHVFAASESGALGYALATVASYGGELGDAATAIRSFPAVWVTYAGERRAEATGGTHLHEGTFSLFIATRSRRGDRAARLGDAGEPGSAQILEDVRALLLGDDLGLPIDPIQQVAVRSVAQSAEASVYGLDISTRWAGRIAASFDGDLADFLHLHLDWDVPPLGNVTPPLPAAEADARDDVYLEGAS